MAISFVRRLRGWSIHELARRVEKHPQWVRDVEAEENTKTTPNLSLKHLKLFADILNVPLLFLLLLGSEEEEYEALGRDFHVHALGIILEYLKRDRVSFLSALESGEGGE